MKKNISYSEPKDYFPKDLRKVFEEEDKKDKKEKEKRAKENEELRKVFKGK